MTLPIKHPGLFREACYINGQWLEAGPDAIAVINPATGETVGRVPNFGQAETRRAINAAHQAFDSWKRLTAKERSDVLKRWHGLMLQHADDLATLMTIEQGKPLQEATNEILYGASFIEWNAEEAKRAYGDIIPEPKSDRRILARKEPVGVVAAITPWNFPTSMVTRKTAPALAAGCTVLLKPAEATPFSAIALAVLAEEAGMPAGVFNVITGSAMDIGKEMTGNPLVRKLSFTGSTEVGKLLYAQCAGTIKKLSLELGGNAPFIVFDDADLEVAAKSLLASRYRNSGQTCVCANRVLVQSGIHDRFIARMIELVGTLKPGNGLDPSSTQGPLIEADAVVKVERLVKDAQEKGATVKTGGTRIGDSLFFTPTVLTGVEEHMDIMHEEIFGPVISAYRFETEEEAVKLANNTPYGLAAYFFTQDVKRMFRVMEALEYGMVGVNEGLISTEVAPFGGVKESGLGREGSYYGLQEFLETKYICIGNLS